MPSRIQRYRLTWEFELRDRGDYASICNRLQKALRQVEDSTTGIAADYLAIKKVKDYD